MIGPITREMATGAVASRLILHAGEGEPTGAVYLALVGAHLLAVVMTGVGIHSLLRALRTG